MSAAVQTLRPEAPVSRHVLRPLDPPNRYRHLPTAELLAEAEAWLWLRAEMAADLETDAGAWDFPAESCAFADAALEDASSELARRERVRHRAEAPPWPLSHPDRRDELEHIRAGVDLPRFLMEMFPGTQLKRQGKQLVCRCVLPGHDDTTPSMTIHPDKQLWYCHGCHRGGDLFTLAMHYLQTDQFADVVDVLANAAGVERRRNGGLHG